MDEFWMKAVNKYRQDPDFQREIDAKAERGDKTASAIIASAKGEAVDDLPAM